MDEFQVAGFIFRDFGDGDSPTDGDEIVWTDPVSGSNFHLERMDDGVVWFCITARDPATGKERYLHVNLCSDTPIKVVLQDLPEMEYDTPEVQKRHIEKLRAESQPPTRS